MRMMMTRFLLATSAVWCAVSSAAQAQRAVLVRDLAPVDAASSARFARIMNIRVLHDGTVLVNDAGRRQLIALDAALGNALTVLDSTTTAYGRSPGVLVRGRADSLLLISRSLMAVIDPAGRAVGATMAAQKPLITSMQMGNAGMDADGNFAYRAMVSTTLRPASARPDSAGGSGSAPATPPPNADSARAPRMGYLVRGDFMTRTLKKVTAYRQEPMATMSMIKDASGRSTVRTVIHPLPPNDDYVVLSDGTVAVVRNDDYHVDFYHPDGTTYSGPPIAFSRRTLSIAARQAIIDSARTEQLNAEAAGIMIGVREASAVAAAVNVARATGVSGKKIGESYQVNVVRADSVAAGTITPTRAPTVPPSGAGAPPNSAPASAGQLPFATRASDLEYVPLADIPAVYPVYLGAGLVADEQDNIWVRTTAVDPRREGAGMHDVLNNRGVLVLRVRVPAGKTIVGFGDNMVFLTSQDARDVKLERAPLPGGIPR